jgi:hypothetical protein
MSRAHVHCGFGLPLNKLVISRVSQLNFAILMPIMGKVVYKRQFGLIDLIRAGDLNTFTNLENDLNQESDLHIVQG